MSASLFVCTCLLWCSLWLSFHRPNQRRCWEMRLSHQLWWRTLWVWCLRYHFSSYGTSSDEDPTLPACIFYIPHAFPKVVLELFISVPLSFLPLSDHCNTTSLGLADTDPTLGIRAPSPSGIHLSTVNLANRRTSDGMDILCLVRYGGFSAKMVIERPTKDVT